MNTTSDIENYPGFESISGPELSMKMFEPSEKLGVEIFMVSCPVSKTRVTIVVKTGDEVSQPRQLSLRLVPNTATLVLLA